MDEGRQIHLALVKDITARKLADQQLRESEARYRMLFNHAADAILLLDLEGRVIDVIDQACRQYGHARDGLLKPHVTNIDTPEDAVDALGRIARLDSQGQASFEARRRDAQGNVIPGRYAPLRGCENIAQAERWESGITTG